MNLVTIPVLCPGYALRRGDRELANVDMLLKVAWAEAYVKKHKLF